MPIGRTALFDLVFGISARTFGALMEALLRPAIFALGPPIPTPVFGSLTFDDLRVEAWFGTTTGNTVEIRIGLHNAAVTGLGGVSFGANWSDFFVPATIASVAAGTGAVDLTLTFNFAATTFNADDEVPLTTAGLTEQQIASLLGPAFTVAGFINPISLTNGTLIPVVPQTPAAAVGAVPGVAVVAVAVQRRASAGTPGEESVAILVTLQDRPNTPAGRPPGNPAAVPAATFAAGQDLLLEIENAFLFELLASLALEAPTAAGGLAVPVASVTTSRTGVTLSTPAAVTLSGTRGKLTVFTLGAPTAGTTAMPLALTFVFVKDDITYIVAIVGATITAAMSGSSIVIASAVPAATVTSVVPVWLVVVRILAGVALGMLVEGIVGAIVGGIVGGISFFAETAIVAAIAGPSATAGVAGATGGLGGGLLPPAITALAGGGTLSPPLVFDDIEVGGRTTLPDPVRVLRHVASVQLLSGETLDLDSGKVSRLATRRGAATSTVADLAWDDAFGLAAVSQATFAALSGTFSAVAYADVSAALQSGSTPVFSLQSIPLVTGMDLLSGQLPKGLLLGVQTNRGRLAKVIAWRDVPGNIVLRYVLWDATSASVRIYPAEPEWTPVETQRTADTPASGDQPAIHHFRISNRTQLVALTRQLNGPINFKWTLAGVTLSPSGATTIGGASMHWVANGANLTLTLDLGQSLDHAELVCTATDAQGIAASDSAQLTVSGVGEAPASPYEGALAGVREKIRDAMRSWVDQPNVIVNPNPPDPVIERDDIVAEFQLRSAIKAAKLAIDVDAIEIR